MRIVELPLALCPGGELALAVLAHRDQGLALGYTIWLADNYDPTGGTPPETYAQLAAHNRFARFGSLLSDYSAQTKTVDTQVGFTVRLTGADRSIDPQSVGQALANQLLVFLGDEIMSVAGVELLAPATYRLHAVRNRFGSARGSHNAGDGVWLIAREDLLPLQHPSFFGGNTVACKVALSYGRYAQDLSEVGAATHTIANRIFTEPGLANLRFNGYSRWLNWSSGDVRFDWTLADPGARLARADLATVRTRIDFIPNADPPALPPFGEDDVDGTQIVDGDSLELTEAELAAIVGADPFYVVARRQISTPDFTALSEPVALYITQS